MKLAEAVYSVLRDEMSSMPIPLEEHIRNAGRPASVEGKDLLLRAAGYRQKQMIRRYLEKHFRDAFVTQGVVEITEPDSPVDLCVELHGSLGGIFVDIVPISTTQFTMFRPPDWAIVSAAAKATWAGKQEAMLIGLNRDNQEWASWHLSGDLADVALEVESAFEAPPRELPRHAHVSVKPNMAFVSELDEYLLSLNNRSSGRKKGVFHPSEFSTVDCDRALAYGLNIVDEHENVDPQLRRIFDTGSALHDVIQGALAQVIPNFRAEAPISDTTLRFAGHCDAAWDEEGVEIKTIGSKGAAKLKGAKPEHKKQATIYGAKLDLKVMHYLYAVKETGEIIQYEVPVDRKLWHQMATRAANIVNTVDQGLLPPQIEKDYICRGCKFAWTCKPHLATTTPVQDTLRLFR